MNAFPPQKRQGKGRRGISPASPPTFPPTIPPTFPPTIKERKHLIYKDFLFLLYVVGGKGGRFFGEWTGHSTAAYRGYSSFSGASAALARAYTLLKQKAPQASKTARISSTGSRRS